MSLTTFCLICLAVDVVILIIGVLIEAEIQYRRRKVKQVRELHAENALLRAEIRRQAFGSEWELDKVKTELSQGLYIAAEALENAEKRSIWE